MFKNKRILALIAGAVLVLGLTGAVWAATTKTTLTDAQRNELIGLRKQILAIQKQIIKKQVEFKQLTAAQGKAMEANLDLMAERMENWDGTGPGFGMGIRMGRGFGMRGIRGLGGFGGGRGAGWTCPNCGATAKGPTQ